MQNLSFQATQNTPLKNLVEPVKKSDASTENPATGDANTPFQLMLSKQLQAQTKQGNGEHVAIERNIKSKASNAKPTSDTKSMSTVANAITANDEKGGDLTTDADKDAAIHSNAVSIEQVVLDAKALLNTKEGQDKKSFDNKPADVAINPLDTNAIILVPVMNLIPLEKTQATTLAASPNADSQPSPRLEAATQNQQSLAAALNNALSQGKYIKVSEKDIQHNQAAETHEMPLDQASLADATPKQAVDDESTGTKLILNTAKDSTNKDVMLSATARQLAGDESKLILNTAKDNTSKDATIKDMITPANYQPLAQINANLPVQQAGSANSINAYPGKTGWDQAISQKVVWMVGAGEQSATLTLNPPDLGPLQVVINVHNDKADTTFISDNAEVRQALQDGMSNLREKMSESGIQLGQANISSGGQAQQEFQQAMQNKAASSLLGNNVATSQEEKTISANTLVRAANGLVDTFA